MANDQCIRVGNFFFDVEFDRAAAEMNRIRNVFFIPFVFLANIGNDRFAAF